MTKLAVGEQGGEVRPRCGWCGRPLPAAAKVGRPRTFCRQSCRQQSYVHRRWHDRLGLHDDDLLVSRAALDELLGRLYCLQAAVEDVDRDLVASSTAKDVKEALTWVLENARPLADAWLEPATPEK